MFAVLLSFVVPVSAHPIDNATLLIEEQGPGRFQVRFRSASPSLGAIATPAIYPPQCQLDQSILDCGTTGLSGIIEFPWLEGALTRVVVDIHWSDGSRLQRVVSPETAELRVYDRGSTGWAAWWPVLSDYGGLGVEHILLGFDHLCFVLSLALLVQGRRRLLLTVTAFTLAHSVTLALTALGFLRVPIAPVEAMIALSIVLVCAECLRPEESLTRTAPFIVAFTFGLLHGFGFASALLDVGLPQDRLAPALLGFNLGVELGQLAVVFALLVFSALVVRLGILRPWMTRSVIYVLGSVAAYWSVDRVFAVFEPIL